MAILNQELGFDEVRWAISRQVSYDSRLSFQGAPQKRLFPRGTHLLRLVHMMNAYPFDGVWWMPDFVVQDWDWTLSAVGVPA